MATTARHRPITRRIGTVLFLLALLPPATSQAPPQRFPDAPITRTNYSLSMAAIIIILIAAFGIVGIFSAFVRQWLLTAERQAAASAGEATTDSASWRRLGGLNPEMIATFPTMTYAEAKVLNASMGALECAVCICEFENEEELRLLPGCCHVFHPDCIGAWLASHVTCPVCRSDMATAVEGHNWLPDSSATVPAPLDDPPPTGLPDSSPTAPAPSEADDPPPARLPDFSAIAPALFEADDLPPARLPDTSPAAPAPSKADDPPPARLPDSSATAPAPPEADDPPQDHVIIMDAASSVEEAAAEAVELPQSESGQQPAAEPPPSSHSTKHFSPRPRSLEDIDRFTLRLPDHVRQRIFSDRRVQRCASCAAVFPVTATGSQERSRSESGSGSGGSRAWVWSMRLAWSEQWQSSILRTLSSTFTPWKKGDGSSGSSTKKREAEDSSKKRFSSLRNSFDWIFGGGASAGSGCRGSTADSSERG